jgi:hypothetical protein
MPLSSPDFYQGMIKQAIEQGRDGRCRRTRSPDLPVARRLNSGTIQSVWAGKDNIVQMLKSGLQSVEIPGTHP